MESGFCIKLTHAYTFEADRNQNIAIVKQTCNNQIHTKMNPTKCKENGSRTQKNNNKIVADISTNNNVKIKG